MRGLLQELLVALKLLDKGKLDVDSDVNDFFDFEVGAKLLLNLRAFIIAENICNHQSLSTLLKKAIILFL